MFNVLNCIDYEEASGTGGGSAEAVAVDGGGDEVFGLFGGFRGANPGEPNRGGGEGGEEVFA